MTLRRRAVVYALVMVAAVGAVAVLLRRPWATRLQTIVRGDDGPPTFVLLHGYGSSAEDWLPFAGTIPLPVGGRFVFPTAPESTLPPDGPVGGRAWWRLGLDTLIPAGGTLPDLSQERPPGLKQAAQLVSTLLTDVAWSRGGPIVLGGFSQGAMVASEVAFSSEISLAALVLLSGTPVDEQRWQAAMPRRRGLPVFLAHGREDPILSFRLAERLRTDLQAAGLAVVWVPFDGGHEVPEQVVLKLNAFIKGLPLTTDSPVVHLGR